MQSKKKQYGCIVISLLLCILPIGCREKESAPAFPVHKEFTQDSLHVEMELSGSRILLSDLLTVRISVICPDSASLQWPNLQDALADFQVRDWDERGRRLLSDGRILSVRQFRLEPQRAGDLQIPPLSFQWTLPDKTTALALLTESIPIQADTTLPEDLSQVSPADIEDVVAIRGHAPAVWISIISALAILAAGVVFLLRARSRRIIAAQKVYKPAHEIALAQIRTLAGLGLLEQGRVKEFYERLSNCLRQYIENRFLLRAPERTTEEFLIELKESPVLASEHKQELKEFLEHSDLVKFARHQPTRHQSDQSLKTAERFVESTKSDQQLVEVTAEGEEV